MPDDPPVTEVGVLNRQPAYRDCKGILVLAECQWPSPSESHNA